MRKRKRAKRILLLLVSLLFLYVFLGGEHGFYQIWRLEEKKEGLKKEIKKLQKQQSKLKQRKKLLLDDLNYIEKIAREEYGMVKEGERIYKIVGKIDDKKD